MIGEILEAAIKRAGIPVALLARRLGVSRAAVYRWTSGQSIPRADHLARLLREIQASDRIRLAVLRALEEPLDPKEISP